MVLIILLSASASAQGVAPFVYPLPISSVSYTTVYDTIDADNRDGSSTGTYEIIDFLGVGDATFDYKGAVEFQLAIPQGATIDSCFITMYCSGPTGWTTSDSIILRIYDVDTAPVFVLAHSHSLTTHSTIGSDSVVWTGISPVLFEARTTPNLKSLLQTVVNRAGWSSGNYAGFVMTTPTLYANPHYIDFRNYSTGETTRYPRVKVVYH